MSSLLPAAAQMSTVFDRAPTSFLFVQEKVIQVFLGQLWYIVSYIIYVFFNRFCGIVKHVVTCHLRFSSTVSLLMSENN